MKINKGVFVVGSLCVSLCVAANQIENDKALWQLANTIFAPLPSSMPGSEHDTPEQIALGRALYFETTLSANNNQSCNTCHNLNTTAMGVDNLVTSVGSLGKLGHRNSPPTVNAGFQFAQFWDARASTLEEQAKSPLLNPIEMALNSPEHAEQKLRNKGYSARFEKAYPNAAPALSFNNIVHALAAFERTLISKDRFDDYLRGDLEALSDTEKRGLDAFIVSGCHACHSGPLLGGEMVQKLGVVNAYPNKQDTGLAQVTHNPGDKFMFKVPSLRGVGQSAPYFHDGAAQTLEQVVLDTGWHQMGIRFSQQDVDDISAFLRALDNTKSPVFDE